MLKLNEQDAHLIMTSAVRYAIGRETRASSDIARIIAEHINDLAPATCFVIARDFRRYAGTMISPDESFPYKLGVKPYADLLPSLDARAGVNNG